MQNCTILNIAISADADGFVVPSDHRIEPDTDTVFQYHQNQDAGIRCDEIFCPCSFGVLPDYSIYHINKTQLYQLARSVHLQKSVHR